MSSHPHFFSRPISEYGRKIPFIVSDLIRKLREIDAKQIEGIFRLSGAATVVKNLTDLLDDGPVSDWTPFNGITIACALKAYFRENAKTDPLMSFDLYDLFVACVDITDEQTVLNRIKRLCLTLPPVRLTTLAYLMFYLHEVSQNKEHNKMTASNLAICFAPNILASSLQTHDTIVGENAQQNKVVTIMIENAPSFFGEIEFPDSVFMTQSEITILSKNNIDQAKLEMLMKRWSYRSRSIIPYVPPEWFKMPGFKRPDRNYECC